MLREANEIRRQVYVVSFVLCFVLAIVAMEELSKNASEDSNSSKKLALTNTWPQAPHCVQMCHAQ